MSVPKIEAIYPLSPMQEGMLFHSLYAPESGLYVEHLICGLRGKIDISAFVRAWQEAADRHPILRTSVVWEGIEKPVQVVHERVEIPFEHQDWREIPEGDRDERLTAFLKADRRRGFNFIEAPLMRLTLVRTGDASWRFLWSHHHMLMDGWSMPVVAREVFSQYEAFSRGQHLHIERRRPYRDYIAWLQKQDPSSSEAFWRETMKGLRRSTPLVVDRERSAPASASTLYEDQRASLTAETTSRLQTIARENRLTMNTILQGAWAILLSRYSGEGDVVFGATVSGRPAELEGVESMVGLFINTLPVRVRVNEEESVLPWMKRLQDQQMESRQHEQTPLVEIQGWSGIPRGQPLFESLLVFENYPLDPSILDRCGDVSITHVLTHERTNYPITLSAIPGPEMHLEISYQTERFENAAVRRMLGHLRSLLEGLAASPSGSIGDLPLLTDPERRLLLVEWNDTSAAFPEEATLHDLFEEQAARSPDAPAIEFEDSVLTYEELNFRSNQLAHHLRSFGVGDGSLVAICLERSIGMIAGILGILKAGAAYVPLDPSYPAERLAFMLEDSRAPVLVTRRHFLRGLPAGAARTVCLEEEESAIAAESGENRSSASSGARGAAYIIYTSGSTGRPKGVIIPHRGICNRLLWGRTAHPLTREDRVLQKAAISFDVSVWEIFSALTSGARLILARPGGHQDTTYLVDLIARKGITVVDFVPSMLRLFLEEPGLSRCLSLRRVTCGGETLTPDLQALFFARLKAELLNLYGPTETSVDATLWACRRDLEMRSVPIGRPLANTQVYILDSRLRPVPVGVPGEIYVSGHGLSIGYLHRPDLTAERFLPHPFMDDPKTRLYRTGDLGRFLPDGNVEFLGRADNQVKIRGHRIELEEIESVLATHPSVAAAAVVAREDEPGRMRLAAYIVPRDGRSFALSDLRRYLKDRLPDFMIPHVFMTLEALPLSPGGKVDRRALPAPERNVTEAEDGYAAPTSPVEERLAEIWAKALQVPRVGIHDNFFELGGDSILSVKIVARARDAGIRITPRQVFEHQTIAELAADSTHGPAVIAEPGLVAGAAPLTPIQRWFFDLDLPNPHHWNQAILLDLRQPMDAVHIERAMQHLVLQHDALRLRFRRQGPSWEASYAGAGVTVPFTLVDLSGTPAPLHAAAIEDAAGREQAALQIIDGPLIRVALFDMGPGLTAKLLLVIHHLVVDAISWQILFEDLLTACRQLAEGKEVDLPLKTTSYRQWAERLRDHARSETLDAEIPYWLASSGSAVPPLPLDTPGGRNTEATAEEITELLGAEETRALLQEVPSVYHTEINDALLTALARAFERWTGEARLLVELEGHGRENLFAEVDLSRTVGWFTSAFPVLLEAHARSGPGDALKATKEALRRIPHHGIGYGVLRYLRAAGSGDPDGVPPLSGMPRAEVSFNYLGRIDQVLPDESSLRWAPESPGHVYDLRGARPHLIDVNAAVTEERLEIEWRYSTELHRRSTIESLARSFVDELRGIIAHCQSPTAGGFTPSDFPEAGLGQKELDDLLARLSGSPPS